MMSERKIDVLIVTAIQAEYDEVLRVDTGAIDTAWIEDKPDGVHHIAFRTFRTYDGRSIDLAVTWATAMGGEATASVAQSYIERFKLLA